MKRILLLLLILLLATPLPVRAETDYGWGYGDLALRSSGSARQTFYRELYAFAADFHKNGGDAAESGGRYTVKTFSLAALKLDFDEAFETYLVFCLDNPLFYWLSDGLNASGDRLFVNAAPDFALASVRSALNAGIESWLASIPASGGELERLMAAHDAVTGRAQYLSGGSAHCVIGVTEALGAVCEGYSKAFKLALDRLGVQSVCVPGTAGGESHMWNLARLDGKWYAFDTTWDDTAYGGEPAWFYFGMGAGDLSDRSPNLPSGSGADFLYALPQLAGDSLSPVMFSSPEGSAPRASVAAALNDVTDPGGDYTLLLFKNSRPAALPRTLPAAGSITFDGNYTQLGSGFRAGALVLPQDVSAACPLVFSDILLSGPGGLSSGFDVGFSGTVVRMSGLSLRAQSVRVASTLAAASCEIRAGELELSGYAAINGGSLRADSVRTTSAGSDTVYISLEGRAALYTGEICGKNRLCVQLSPDGAGVFPSFSLYGDSEPALVVAVPDAVSGLRDLNPCFITAPKIDSDKLFIYWKGYIGDQCVTDALGRRSLAPLPAVTETSAPETSAPASPPASSAPETTSVTLPPETTVPSLPPDSSARTSPQETPAQTSSLPPPDSSAQTSSAETDAASLSEPPATSGSMGTDGGSPARFVLAALGGCLVIVLACAVAVVSKKR